MGPSDSGCWHLDKTLIFNQLLTNLPPLSCQVPLGFQQLKRTVLQATEGTDTGKANRFVGKTHAQLR